MKAKLVRVGPFGVKTDQHGERWVSNGKGKYAAIKGELPELFHAGDVVEMEVKENGEYLNLVSMKMLEESVKVSSNGNNSYVGNRRTNEYPKETANKDGLVLAVSILGPLADFKGDEAEYASRVKGLGDNLARFILTNDSRQEQTQETK